MKSKWPSKQSFSWQGGYGAFSLGPPDVNGVIQYIRAQEEHHRKFSFQDEYRRICHEHGIELDERYVWD